MDIQKLIADNTDSGDGALGLDNDGRIWLLAHIAELQQRAEAAEAKLTELAATKLQLAEVERQRAQWVEWATKAADRVDTLEAQLAELAELVPVAEVVSKFGDPEAFGERELNIFTDIQSFPYGTKFYTAPPAPFVVKAPEFRVHAQHPTMAAGMRDNDWKEAIKAAGGSVTAEPVKVPDEMTPKAASRSYGDQVVGYRDGWNACRAEALRMNNMNKAPDITDSETK